MGLLSMMEDQEEIPYQQYSWFEDRHLFANSTLLGTGGGGPFTDTTGANGAAGTALTAGGWTLASQQTIRVFVASAEKFRQRDQVWLKDMPGAASTVVQIYGIVDAVWTATNSLDVRLIQDVTSALNSSSAYVTGGASGGNVGAYITSIGSASAEGTYSKVGGLRLPIQPGNNTQTFRTVIGPFTRNALKRPQTFDKSGAYKMEAKQAHIRHMEQQEYAAFFGIKGSNNIVDADDGQTKSELTLGGALYFLQQWEKGSVANGGAYDYRGTTSTDLTALAWNAHDDKRVLKFGGATVTKSQFDDIMERLFRYTGDGQFEKLVLCGNKFLGVFNKFAEANSIKVVKIRDKENTYGMTLTCWETAWGTIYFKTHPLFTYNPVFTYSAFALDLGSIRYVPYQDADSQLLKNRQARDFDGRKDEWLTEYGLEFRFPERHMYIENLAGITPG